MYLFCHNKVELLRCIRVSQMTYETPWVTVQMVDDSGNNDGSLSIAAAHAAAGSPTHHAFADAKRSRSLKRVPQNRCPFHSECQNSGDATAPLAVDIARHDCWWARHLRAERTSTVRVRVSIGFRKCGVSCPGKEWLLRPRAHEPGFESTRSAFESLTDARSHPVPVARKTTARSGPGTLHPVAGILRPAQRVFESRV